MVGITHTVCSGQTVKICRYCHGPLPKGRRKYCSDRCAFRYFQEVIEPLWWSSAVRVAKRRTDGRCEECGAARHLEVHHLISLEKGEPRHNSPKNVQSNLVVLCRQHHNQIHHPPKSTWTPRNTGAQRLLQLELGI